MGKHEKRVYLEAIRKRYRRAKRADKGKILFSMRLSAQVRHPAVGVQARQINTTSWTAFTI